MLFSSFFQHVCFYLSGDEMLAHRPNPQPGGPVYVQLSGCSPLNCLARVALPVATLPLAQLSGSLHHASLLTHQKMPSSRWRYLKEEAMESRCRKTYKNVFKPIYIYTYTTCIIKCIDSFPLCAMWKYYKELRLKGKSYKQQKQGRLTGLLTSYIGTAF